MFPEFIIFFSALCWKHSEEKTKQKMSHRQHKVFYERWLINLLVTTVKRSIAVCW